MKTLLCLLFSVGLVACSSSKEEKPAKETVSQPQNADVLCEKALTCIGKLSELDPERKGVYSGIRRGIESAKPDEKLKQCQQVIDGLAYNPKTPPSCK